MVNNMVLLAQRVTLINIEISGCFCTFARVGGLGYTTAFGLGRLINLKVH